MSRGAPWFKAEAAHVHSAISETLRRLDEQNSERRQMWQRFEAIYGEPYWKQSTGDLQNRRRKTARVNYARNHAETYISRLVKTRVLPQAVVKGGDVGLAEKAKLMNLLLEGAFDDLGVYSLDFQWEADRVVCGTAWAQIDDDGERPFVDRVDPFELYLDDVDWQYGDGRWIGRVKLFHRDRVEEMFPDAGAIIEKAQDAETDGLSVAQRERLLAQQDTSDMVAVRFMWAKSLPGLPGRHVIALTSGVLHDEEFEGELPFSWMPRTMPRRGVWGHPLMADLAPIQETMDRWMDRIDESMWLMAVPRVFVRRGAKINKQKVTTDVASFLEIDNPGDITPWNADGISPQAFQFFDMLRAQMQFAGRANLMSSAGQVPPGVRSGVALRFLDDADLEGLREPMRFRDQFYTRMARLMVDVFQRIGYKTVAKEGTLARELAYAKVKLPKNSYVWSVMPTSFFAKTPAARLEVFGELADRGLMSQDKLAKWLEIPDAEREEQRINAYRNNVAWRINKILTEGEYIPPHPYLPPDIVMDEVGRAISLAEMSGVDDDKIDMLNRLATESFAQKQRAMQPQQAPAPAGVAAPSPTPAAAGAGPIPGGMPGMP